MIGLSKNSRISNRHLITGDGFYMRRFKIKVILGIFLALEKIRSYVLKGFHLSYFLLGKVSFRSLMIEADMKK